MVKFRWISQIFIKDQLSSNSSGFFDVPQDGSQIITIGRLSHCDIVSQEWINVSRKHVQVNIFHTGQSVVKNIGTFAIGIYQTKWIPKVSGQSSTLTTPFKIKLWKNIDHDEYHEDTYEEITFSRIG